MFTLDRVLHDPGWPGSHFVAENYLELSWTLLTMCVLLHLAQVCLNQLAHYKATVIRTWHHHGRRCRVLRTLRKLELEKLF